MDDKKSKDESRRQFIKKISTGSLLAASGLALSSISCTDSSEEKTTLLTTDGKLVSVPKSEVESL